MRSEILYRARVCPLKMLRDLTTKEVKNIYNNIKKVAVQSYRAQSKKLTRERNYTNNFVFYVYGNEVDPKGNKVISKKLKDKRTVWYVPKIQKY